MCVLLLHQLHHLKTALLFQLSFEFLYPLLVFPHLLPPPPRLLPVGLQITVHAQLQIKP